jgi:hypothetical protein
MSRRPLGVAFLPILLASSLTLAGCAGTDPAAPTDAAPRSASASSAPSSSAPSPSAAESGQRIDVRVSGGQVSGDTGRVPVPAGEPVTLTITSDVADEVHVHGYDLTAELAPNVAAELTFAATIPGVFEVELHDAGTVLLTLQVQ